MEEAARARYVVDKDMDVEQVGFCLSDDGRIGCSPDGLMLSKKGMLEIKVPDLKTHVRYLREGVLPNKYKPQVHGSLLVTGCEWCDFMSYSQSEDLDHLYVRVYPDEFTELLRAELDRFLAKYESAMTRLGRKIRRPIDAISAA